MRFTYDDEADALYIYLHEGASIDRSIVVDDDRTVDVDAGGRPVGIEVLGASERVALRDIADRFHLQDRWDALGTIEETPFRRAVRA
jgi:uncharacterized protein YuzE